jgi:hypothetical protein
MATELHNETEPSLAALVGGIVNDVQELIRQETALARRELTEEINKTKQAAVSLGAGMALAALGAVLIALMVVALLHEGAGLTLWLSFLIVGGALLILGGALFFMGKSRASSIHLLPPQTLATMKENVRWIKNRT